jgi:hypothetical protein
VKVIEVEEKAKGDLQKIKEIFHIEHGIEI